MTETTLNCRDDDAMVTAAQAGNESAFSSLVDRHRRELQVHCYRMMGSFADSEDLVQETFLRAWRHRESFAGRSTFRAWLYRIATNACLDALSRRPESRQRAANPSATRPDGSATRPDGSATRPDGSGHNSKSRAFSQGSSAAEVFWLQPYPDRLLDVAAPGDAEPDARVVAKETIELVFLVAIQHLPPRQRAVLILRDVLGWPAADTAELLETTVASANSALQRARATFRTLLPRERRHWRPATPPTAQERATLRRFMTACETADMASVAALLREDVVQTMPPDPLRYEGRTAILEAWTPVMAGPDAWGDWRILPTSANRQPALANYLRRRGESECLAVNLDVLRIEDGLVAAVTTFGADVFAFFGLPERL
jgi:RNA polymerase sigma-70 factor (ECF subfamily)